MPPSGKPKRSRMPLSSLIAALLLCAACVVAVLVMPRTNNGEDSPAVSGESPPPAAQTSVPSPDSSVQIVFNTPAAVPETSVIAQDPADIKVKGIYIDTWTAAAEGNLDRFIEICDSSEINAIVVDIKDDNGIITMDSENENLSDNIESVIADARGFISRLKEHGIYTIARVVCFKDSLRCDADPALAIRDNNGAVWTDGKGDKWLNPYSADAWGYLSDIAKEVVKAGFDEIQLDYVRFPADGDLSVIDYGNGSAAEETSKAEVIADFLRYMREELENEPINLSADVFGIITLGEGDFEGIGQDFDLMLQCADSVCPMIYPSHFANIGQNGVGQIINGILFEAPDLSPYDVIYNTLLTAKERLTQGTDQAVVRPYLQAFTADYLGSQYYITYTQTQVLEQINAVYDAGFEEWILWNHSGSYDIYEGIAGLLPEEDT